MLLKQRLTKARALALVLGLAGLVTILGGRTGVPLPQNFRDTMALLAGVVWAAGSFRVRQAAEVGIFENLFSFFLFGSLVALLITFLPITATTAPPVWSTLKPLMRWLFLVALGFMIPILWGSQHIDPGRLGILLQIEAVVGIASAALLTDELFGFVEFLGAFLVISAAFVDVLGGRYGNQPTQDRNHNAKHATRRINALHFRVDCVRFADLFKFNSVLRKLRTACYPV